MEAKQTGQHNHSAVRTVETTKQHSEVTWSVQRRGLFTDGEGRNWCVTTVKECVCWLLSVPYTFWGQECWWYFKLTGNSCFWVMCLMEVEKEWPAFIFFGRSLGRGILQTDAVCYQTPGPAVKHSLVSCSKTWHVTLGIQFQRERPSLCWALRGPQLGF